jgi:ParB/RepB/Spo0J family partition protein
MATHAKKPIGWFKEDPKQPRKHFNEEELRRLGEDMRANGQYRPAGALPDGMVIYGGRQLRAARLVGLTELEVKIYDQPLTETQIRVMQWTENELRASLSDPEKSDFCAELLRLNPGWTQRDLVAPMKVSEATITHLLAVFKCIPAVQEAYRGGLLTRSDVYGMSKVGERDQHELLSARLTGQLKNAQEVHRQARRTRNSNGNGQAVKVSRVKCLVPSGVCVTFVGDGEGLTLDEVIESLQDLLKEAKKANDQGLDSKTFSAVMRDKAKAS